MTFQRKSFYSILSLGLILLVTGCGKKDTSEPVELREQPYLTTNEVNVRTGPGTKHKIIAKIPSGTKVNVVGKQGDWFLIVSKRGKAPGYVEARSARPAKDVQPQ